MLKKFMDRYPMLKTALREVRHRPGWYSDSYDELEELFQWTEDPWNFQKSKYEQDRLQALLDHVKLYPHESILEVGCAEGIMTAELCKIAPHVVAIDVSPTAIARAKLRCPTVTFLQTSLHDFSWESKFDLVICAETLYYIRDVPPAIDKLSRLGKFCLVSYIHRETKQLDPYFRQMPLTSFQSFEKSYWFWKRAMSIAIWENNDNPFYFQRNSDDLT